LSAPFSIIPHSVHPAEHPVTFELRCWRPLRCVPFVIHLLAALSAISASIFLGVKLILLAALSVTVVYYLKRLPGESGAAVAAIQWKENAWRLCSNNQWMDAELRDVVIWADWLFLSFRCQSRNKNLILCRHHFETEREWRHLRRCLHY
jgi:hypothetical protein